MEQRGSQKVGATAGKIKDDLNLHVVMNLRYIIEYKGTSQANNTRRTGNRFLSLGGITQTVSKS